MRGSNTNTMTSMPLLNVQNMLTFHLNTNAISDAQVLNPLGSLRQSLFTCAKMEAGLFDDPAYGLPLHGQAFR